MKRALLLLLLWTPSVFSQARFEVGGRIDAPLVGPFSTYSFPQPCANGAACGFYESVPYHPAVGLSVSVRIAPRLRLRFDPEYQRIGLTANSYGLEYETTVNSPLGEVVRKTSATADRWQIPLLVEAGLFRHLRFGVGPALSFLTDTKSIDTLVDPFSGTSTFPDYYTFPVSRQEIAGAAAALEFPFRLGRVTVAPELRYKRWFATHYGTNWTLDEFTGGVALRFSR